ncbi:hypothetical protein [Chromobacterium violaceum]|nr:hypothetical protein [Chromobacterium violaceum]
MDVKKETVELGSLIDQIKVLVEQRTLDQEEIELVSGGGLADSVRN